MYSMTSYLYQYRPSSSYADLPKYFLAYLNLSCMYCIYSCIQWLLRVKEKRLGAAINLYVAPYNQLMHNQLIPPSIRHQC